jgi:hypothetical protein
VTTVSRPPGKQKESPDHRASIIKKALATAGGSASGIAAIVGAAAFGAVPAGLAYLSISVFGLIMLATLIIAGIGLTRPW